MMNASESVRTNVSNECHIPGIGSLISRGGRKGAKYGKAEASTTGVTSPMKVPTQHDPPGQGYLASVALKKTTNKAKSDRVQLDYHL